MKLLIFLLAAWLGIASAAEPQRNPGMAPANTEKRVALVIGNAAYPGTGALKNPANDANDIAAKLRKLGFDVIVRTNVRQKEMLRSLTEFGDKVQAGTEALFFYAGHGMQVRGRNYLIPIDAEIRNEASVSSEAVDVDQLLDKLSSARLSMVILDACRNNPFERRFRGGGQGLAQINAPTGTLIAYATAPGKVAADGDGRNGLYTAELLTALDVPGIRVEDVFKRVRANVIKKSGEAQTPWESSSLTGDFYFRPTIGASPAVAPQLAAPIDTGAMEIAFWESIKSSTDAEDYQAYLDKYPNGQFVSLAERRAKRKPSKMDEPENRTAISSASKPTDEAAIAFLDGNWKCTLVDANYTFSVRYTVKGNQVTSNASTKYSAVSTAELANDKLVLSGRSTSSPEYGEVVERFTVLSNRALHGYSTRFGGGGNKNTNTSCVKID